MANVFANAKFVASVWNAEEIPAKRAPVLAFAGKSNAGKSSLINALCNAKVAKVSRTPGKTRMINVFQIQSRLLADLPGYGYAKVPREEAKLWMPKMRGFLSSADIRVLVLIVDCRRGIGEMDGDMLSACENIPSKVIALTKADKLSRAKLAAAEARAKEDAAQFCNGGDVKVVPVSSLNGANIAALRALLASLSV